MFLGEPGLDHFYDVFGIEGDFVAVAQIDSHTLDNAQCAFIPGSNATDLLEAEGQSLLLGPSAEDFEDADDFIGLHD